MILANELKRLKEVERFLAIKSSKKLELNEIAKIAAQICNTPIALITLIDTSSLFILSRVGTKLQKVERKNSCCDYMLSKGGLFQVTDADRHPQFMSNRLHKGKLNFKSYAGVALRTKTGLCVGSLCVMDISIRQLSDQQITMLITLAKQVVDVLELGHNLKVIKDQYDLGKKGEIALKSLFDSTDACLLLLDKDLNILFFNQAMVKFTDYHHKRQLIVGDNFRGAISEDFIDRFLSNVDLAMSGLSVQKESFLNEHGDVVWWQFNYAPAYNFQNEIIGVFYSATDISALKAAEAETLEREQMIKAIAYVQSHEMRRPVSSIIGLLELIKLDDTVTQSEELILLERAVLELDAIIKRIASYS